MTVKFSQYHLLKKLLFFLNVCFDTFVKNDMIIGKWVSFCILYSIPFACQFLSLLYPLCYFGSAVSYDISHYDIRLPDFWEPKGVPVSWLCGPCTYGVPDPSGSFNPSSSSTELSKIQVAFEYGTLHLLPSVAGLTFSVLFDDDSARF